jgi:hypothetical protein
MMDLECSHSEWSIRITLLWVLVCKLLNFLRYHLRLLLYFPSQSSFLAHGCVSSQYPPTDPLTGLDDGLSGGDPGGAAAPPSFSSLCEVQVLAEGISSPSPLSSLAELFDVILTIIQDLHPQPFEFRSPREHSESSSNQSGSEPCSSSSRIYLCNLSFSLIL